MRKVPRKNISSEVADVRLPAERKEGTDGARAFAPPARASAFFAPPPPRRIGTFVAVFGAGAIVLFVLFVFLSYRSRVSAVRSQFEKFGGLRDAVADFRNLDLESARDRIAAEAGEENASSPSGGFEGIWPFLEGAGSAYRDLQDLSQNLFEVVEELSAIQARWPSYLFASEGGEFVSRLRVVRDKVGAIHEASTRVSAARAQFGGFLAIDPAEYLALQVDIGRVRSFLDELVPWLEAPEPRRIAVFLYNPSEMRPGGGFLGSYLEVIVESGIVRTMTVRDISEADRLITTKTVPPAPLQLLTTNWRAADANWFFNFPDSARKTLEFLEASALYRDSGATFDGALALSARVIEDILRVAGPFEVPTGKTIDADNFLTEIQKEVQTAQARGEAAPKRILVALTPLMTERLSRLAPAEQARIEALVPEWLAEKDTMLYFANPALQSFLDAYHLTGGAYDPSSLRAGDYFAAVGANIGGGKSDLFTAQRVRFESRIGGDGVVRNHAAIVRTHEGGTRAEWWYRVPNQTYVMVFTPRGAELTNAGGGVEKKITPPTDYAKGGYVRDALVQAIEASARVSPTYPGVQVFSENGANVFAAWSRIAPGETREVFFDYERELAVPPVPGGTYTFVFEKQAGMRGTYAFEIHAPVGFRFRESDLPVYEYATSDPPGRLVLTLTFEKDPSNP